MFSRDKKRREDFKLYITEIVPLVQCAGFKKQSIGEASGRLGKRGVLLLMKLLIFKYLKKCCFVSENFSDSCSNDADMFSIY